MTNEPIIVALSGEFSTGTFNQYLFEFMNGIHRSTGLSPGIICINGVPFPIDVERVRTSALDIIDKAGLILLHHAIPVGFEFLNKDAVIFVNKNVSESNVTFGFYLSNKVLTKIDPRTAFAAARSFGEIFDNLKIAIHEAGFPFTEEAIDVIV
jgi:hypothetical protein